MKKTINMNEEEQQNPKITNTELRENKDNEEHVKTITTILPCKKDVYPFKTNEQTENQQGNGGFKWYIRPDGCNRYIHNIPSKDSRKCIFPSAHGKLLRIGHKTSLNQCKRLKSSCISSGYNGIKLEVNHKKKMWKSTDNMLLTMYGSTKKSRKKLKKNTKRQIKMKT